MTISNQEKIYMFNKISLDYDFNAGGYTLSSCEIIISKLCDYTTPFTSYYHQGTPDPYADK